MHLLMRSSPHVLSSSWLLYFITLHLTSVVFGLSEQSVALVNNTRQAIAPIAPLFTDRSESSGISDRIRYKYGGPMIADLNGDGWDDIVLGEHENGNARIYLWSSEGSFGLVYDHEKLIDYHGMAAFNLDGTGDTLDVIMNQGGVNGMKPSVPDVFKFVPAQNSFERRPGSEFGLDQFKTRGRAVLLVDVDLDGNDDMILTGRTAGSVDPLSEMAVLRNDGAGKWVLFDNVTVKNAFCYTAILTIDLDNDSIMDLVCTERGRVTVLRGTGSFPEPFVDVSTEWLGSIIGAKPAYYSYMAELDYDNDGNMDVYVTCGFNYTYTDCNDILLRNDGTKFVDVSRAAGLPQGGVHLEPVAGDFNLDGYIDLLVQSYGTESGPASNFLLINGGDGTFETSLSHGINAETTTPFRGLSAGALLTNQLGHLDIIVGYEGNGGGGPFKFYENNTPRDGMNFLVLKVRDIPSRRLLARGAKVTIRIGDMALTRRVGSSSGQIQSFQRRVHFGIGAATIIDAVTIEYLGGHIRRMTEVESGFRESADI